MTPLDAARPLVLVVLDGWGLRDQREGNAIKLARTPTYLELQAKSELKKSPASAPQKVLATIVESVVTARRG